MPRRNGWSHQVPAKRAPERDQDAVTGWVKGGLAAGGSAAAGLGAWIIFEDEARFSMMPPTSRTWNRSGRTPVIRVRGRSRITSTDGPVIRRFSRLTTH